jgi:hypothetical protein
MSTRFIAILSASLAALPISAIADGVEDEIVVAAAASPMPHAPEQSLTFRGGIGTSLQEFPYAVVTESAPPDFDSVAESGYGNGGFLSVTYSNSSVFNGFGIEASLSFLQLNGDDNVGEPAPGPGDCDPSIFDVFTLSHALCMDGAEVSNTATALQGRLLASRALTASNTVLLGGVGFVSFENVIEGGMFYPTEFSEQRRESDFRGAGFVVGARHSAPVISEWRLRVEGFAGVYWGDSEVSIRDNYVGTEGSLNLSDSTTAYSLDIAVSMERDTMMFGRDGSFEFGVAYNALYNVVNTANYNPTFDIGSASPTGSTGDDFDAINLFVGYTMRF